MAQTGYTPIQLYYSATASAAPLAANLAAGELAINTNDGKLYYKDSAGVVQTIASKAGNVNVSSFSAGTTGLTPNTATTGAVTLAGTLNVANGGTGLTTLATGALGYGQGTSAHASLAIGTAGQILTVNSGATAPQWSTLSGVAVTTFSAGTTGFTPSSATSGAVTLAGTLATTNGGTGLTSFTANGVVYASSTSALATGSALTFDGTGFQLSTLTGGNFYLNSTTTGTSNQIVSLLNNGNGYGNLNYKAFDHIWSYGATEQMRLTSTGLGIGTTSPFLSAAGRGNVSINGSSSSILAFGIAGSYSGYIYTNSTQLEFDAQGTRWMQFNTSGAERMRLDSSGNLGLGVTPSASPNCINLELPNGSTLSARTAAPQFAMMNNAVGDWYAAKYKTSAVATMYLLAGGQHQWYNAPSGTAGNAISFTQAMTLGSNGFLGIGQTSPAYPLDISTGANAAQIAFQSTISSGTNFKIAQGIQGVTNSGMQIYDLTNSAVRLAIDESGNLLVGTTSVISAGKYSSSFNGSVSNGIILQTTLASAGSTYIGFLNSAGSTIGSISQSTGSTVAYNVTSDQRLKENIVDAPEFGSVIDSIQVRSFDWKTDHIHQRAGFIAQELVNVAPEAVHQPIKENEMMAVDYSKLVPMLVKEIQSLRKRLADAGIA